MKRKLLATLLLVGMLMTMLPIFTLCAGAEGDLRITTADELVHFAKAIAGGTAYAKQTVHIDNDIDMTGKDWPLAGKTDAVFSGMIDGHGHTVSGLKSESTADLQGLFGSTLLPVGDDTFPVGVKNLTVKDSSVSGAAQVGGLFGQVGSDGVKAGKVLFENLHLDIAVSAAGVCCGGIAGESRVNDMIVCNTAVVGEMKSAGKFFGGFFGRMTTPDAGEHKTSISGSVFDGSATSNAIANTGDWSGSFVGGFIGAVGNGGVAGILEISDSAFYGTLSSTSKSVTHFGGFVGATNGKHGQAGKTDTNIVLTRVIASGAMLRSQEGVDPCAHSGMLVGIVAGGTKLTVNGAVGRTVKDPVGYKDIVDGLGIGTIPNGGGSKTLNNCVVGPGTFPDGYHDSLNFRFKNNDPAVDLSDTFITTTATKPLPMGVLDFFADDINKKNEAASTVVGAFQTKLTEGDANAAVRLIGLLKCSEEQFRSYTGVGFEIIVIRKNGETVGSINNLGEDGKAPSTTKVYSSVLADKVQQQANDIMEGYQYIFTTTIEGLPKEAAGVTFAVRTFHDEGGTRTYDSMTVFSYPIQTKA